MKIEKGECVRVECEGEEIGLMRTDFGWALVEPSEDRDRNVAMRVVYVDPVPETVFVTTRDIIDPAPVMFENTAYMRIKHRWDNLL